MPSFLAAVVILPISLTARNTLMELSSIVKRLRMPEILFGLATLHNTRYGIVGVDSAAA
ncbi:hypothetical protein LSG25_10960 [Paralcaligenes sp. KSB-10]|uniref:hypothetical protein n=1 Tax=Paralcaligenes sp. KSB-10 TaxID=2901142 RepID=UPI001E2D4199|nr:hypothetical protein [Paralcaligenes sp. KSB-10]UHL66444.1 hypothetical protein LSG25_10960 [Paralcaligenes sp. KSB-10]